MIVERAGITVTLRIEAGVMAVFIGRDNIEGVEGGVIFVAWGVMFSCSAVEIILGGVLNGVWLIVSGLCGVSLCLLLGFKTFASFGFDGVVEEMGENGFRITGKVVISRALAELEEEGCFAAMSRPLLPAN